MDEAHALKNAASSRARRLRRLAQVGGGGCDLRGQGFDLNVRGGGGGGGGEGRGSPQA